MFLTLSSFRSSLQEDVVVVEPVESGGCSNRATVTAISRQPSTQKVIVLAEDTGTFQYKTVES